MYVRHDRRKAQDAECVKNKNFKKNTNEEDFCCVYKCAILWLCTYKKYCRCRVKYTGWMTKQKFKIMKNARNDYG